MNFKEIETNLQKVCDQYAAKFGIEVTPDWLLLKIQEELGELSSAHLSNTNRSRPKGQTSEEIRQNLSDEVADVFAMTVLFALHQKIDLEAALKKKWFKFLE